MGKGMMFTMRGCLRWITNYPFLVFLLSGLIFMYMSSPFTVSLLVSASPVLVCAAVLLGTLLFYGKTNIPKIEVDEKTSDGIVAVESDPLKDEKGKGGVGLRKLDERERERERERECEWENENGEVLEGKRELDDGIVKGKEEWNYERFAKVNGVESEEYEKDEGLDSGWEEAESSSSDESMSDVMPMLDELHPLLNEDSSQLNLQIMSRVCSEAPSERTSISSVESVDNDRDDEGSKNGGGGGGGGGGKVIWTEEDQKNVMELGCSEIERNKRLENLLMRRRRRNTSMLPEINLIDLDTSDFPYNIPHISTARHENPFDLPHHPYFDLGLPPLPSSAPPVLLPRRNPFDMMPCQANPYHRFQEELKTSESREAFFRRQEHYPSVFAPNRPETQDLKWGPIFIPEQIAFELGSSLEKKDHSRDGLNDHPGQSTCDIMMSDTNASSVEVFPRNDPVYDSSPNAVKTNSSSSTSVSSDHLTINGETPSSQDDYVEANEKLISTPSAGGIKPHFHDRLLHEHLEEEEVQVQVQVPNTPVESREEVRSIQNIHIPELHDQLEINETKQGQVSNDMHLETCMDDEKKDVKPNSDARLTQSSSTKSQENAKETSVNRRFSTPF